VEILKTFNEMYELFFKGAQNARTKNIFNSIFNCLGLSYIKKKEVNIPKWQ